MSTENTESPLLTPVFKAKTLEVTRARARETAS